MSGAGEWARVRALFEQALDVAADVRAGWLAEQCGGDDALRRRVEGLLAAAGEADDDAQAPGTSAPFEAPIDGALLAGPDGASPGSALVGRRIGGFTTTGVLGAGGMGVVLRAQQEQPRREVALKVLAGAFVGDGARQRFAYEGQVLGRLQHPHVAQVHATGAESDPDSGQTWSWIAMELVEDAQPLDRHAAAAGLDERARLALFLDLCDAVDHGHRRGVLHRDLKPQNVLVTADGTLKVIDFGIARAVDADLDSAFTRTGQVLGTPRYMSPEQLRGDPRAIDTRTDVYALGVMLFELVTGRPPRDPGQESLWQFAQRVAAEPAPRPSHVAAGVSVELDWICARAMAPEPEARYGSVGELAADVRRHLAGEPVLAGPPSAFYTVRRFVRRHRALVGVSVAGVLCVFATAVVAAVGWWRAADSAALARSEAETQGTVVRWLGELLQSARVDRAGKDVLVADLLAAAEPRLGELGAGPVAVEATLRNVLAQTWLSLDQDERALAIVTAGLPRLEAELSPRHSDYAEALYLTGLGLAAKGEFEASRAKLDAALALRETNEGPDSVGAAHVHHALAVHHVRTGEPAAAAPHFARARGIFAAKLGVDHETTLRTVADSVDAAHQLERYDDVREDLAGALARAREALGARHPLTIGLELSAANDARQRGDRAAAEAGYRAALTAVRAVHGEHSPKACVVLGNLAVLQQDGGDLAGAAATFAELVAAYDARSDQVMQALIARNNLASVLLRAGRAPEARAAYDELLAKADGVVPPQHWLFATFQRGRGAARLALGEHEAAEADLLQSLAVFTAALGADNPRTQTAVRSLAELYEAWGKPEQAAEHRKRLRDGG